MATFHDNEVPESFILLTSCRSSDPEQEYNFQIFMMVVYFLVPLLIMTFTYSRIAWCLWRSSTSGPVALGRSACFNYMQNTF